MQNSFGFRVVDCSECKSWMCQNNVIELYFGLQYILDSFVMNHIKIYEYLSHSYK